ncbi:uncharacterized protein LOC114875724 [Osmia bicornis bicornis]|uniref:uncharacterized protein LOC114875724 n=1 Tax=Osmia bicornis bicornis TaxID=1437191 RepID=UPI001EAF6B7F|nr:uncharacterized protein LOC114875724 [Osmia bicornis bicornis]
MFRDGQYLEVIKASDNCLATAVVTVQEKVIKIKKKKVSTNKWLDLEDWAALYKILKKAILRNAEGSLEDFKKYKWKKSTRQLDVTYTIDPSESVKDVTLLPTIRVNVSPAKKKVEKTEEPKTTSKGVTRDRMVEKSHNHTSRAHQKDSKNTKKSENSDAIKTSSDTKNNRSKRYLPLESVETDALEEYVPDTPTTKKLCANLNYIPSRKSMLEQIQLSSNEYSPTVSDNKSIAEVVRYVPNSVDSSKVSYETYEPSATNVTDHSEEYIPNSKGIKASVEEYHPDFTSKLMKFDNSYIPSSVHLTNEHSKNVVERHKRSQSEKFVKTK